MQHTETFFVGLDCGGTRCRARLMDFAGRYLGEGVAGPANGLLGMTVVFAEIKRAVAGALKTAQMSDVPFHQIHAGIGMAGLCSTQVRKAFDVYPSPFASVHADTDAHIAHLGAFDGADGAILIVGTGSCGYAVVEGQVTVRGGHGFLISDQGGGAYLGRMALRRAVQAAESIQPLTPVCDAILSQFDHSIDAIIDWAKTARPADYGTLAPLVFDQSAKDDQAAELIRATTGEVENLVGALLDTGASSVALTGGMTESLMPWLSEKVKEILIEPQGDALAGACLLARYGYERTMSPQCQDRG